MLLSKHFSSTLTEGQSQIRDPQGSLSPAPGDLWASSPRLWRQPSFHQSWKSLLVHKLPPLHPFPEITMWWDSSSDPLPLGGLTPAAPSHSVFEWDYESSKIQQWIQQELLLSQLCLGINGKDFSLTWYSVVASFRYLAAVPRHKSSPAAQHKTENTQDFWSEDYTMQENKWEQRENGKVQWKKSSSVSLRGSQVRSFHNLPKRPGFILFPPPKRPLKDWPSHPSFEVSAIPAF